jgi:hypothetical protein
MLMIEKHNYLCHAFWTYWQGQDINTMLDPRQGTVTDIARLFTAAGFGYTARNKIMDLIEESEAETKQYKQQCKIEATTA